MSKLLWRILLILTGGLALWRGGDAALAYWDYSRYQVETPVKITAFEIIPKKSQFALKGIYTYNYGGKSFQGSSMLAKPYYLNRASAEMEAQKIQGMEWTVWVDAKKPSASALQKIFPLKSIIYAICLLGIFLYFVYLRFHLLLLSKSM